MTNTDIKWFSFDNVNAPQLSNTWGCMIDVLDACLVTGFGSQLVSSLVVENGVGIATFGGAHNFKQFQVIEISGADQSALNSEFKVLGVTANTIEFLVDLPDQIVTGIISCRLASLGWSKEFSGSQKAVYRAKDTVKNPYYLRIDNSLDPVYTTSYAKFAKVGILETCTDIDDISGIQAPYTPSNPSKNWAGFGSGISATVGWFKWYYAAANTFTSTSSGNGERDVPAEGIRAWILVGNSDTFYILPRVTLSETSSQLYGFGVVINNYSENKLGFLSAAVKDNSVSSAVVNFGALSNLINLAMMKNDNNEYQNGQFGSVKLAFSASYSGATNYFRKGNGYTTLLSPFYMIDNINNFVGSFPILLSSLYTHQELTDATPYNENGKGLLKMSFSPGLGVQGAVFFELGDVF